MKLYSCTNIAIKLNDLSLEQGKNYILDEWESFSIDNQGVYIIEGANRSGKSILIKMIMGILPPNVEGNKYSETIINGIRTEIKSINDAFDNGLVAVFQDDVLIPTMTILEQILLRHAPAPSFKNYINNLLYRIKKKLSGIFEHEMIIDEFANAIDNSSIIEYNRAFPEKEIELKFRKLIKQFPNLDDDILSKYPHQLSGGTLAKIKIINAQLSGNIKILFFDEALNAVAKDDCDEIIELIKNWAEVNFVTVVVVTHKQDEIFKWQPKGRYIISDNKIIEKGKTKYDGLDYGIQIRNDFIVKYSSIENAKMYLDGLESPVLVLVDDSVKALSPTIEILECFRKKDRKVITLNIDEHKKNLDEYTKVIPELLDYLVKIDGTIVIIGGGVILNFGSFIAATIHRGLIPYVLVPTTVMAVADVAIGSKASLNVKCPNEFSRKHALGIYTNPSSIIIENKYIDELNDIEKKIGLSECLKHGLIQDINLYEGTFSLLKFHKPKTQDVMNMALRTQELKSRTLINDPFEMKYANLLLFGHLHAHSLERQSNYEIPHGLSVYWGILLDLKLADNDILVKEIIDGLRESGLLFKLQEYFIKTKDRNTFFQDFNNIYNTDHKIQHYISKDNFRIIKLNNIGEYKQIGCKINYLTVNWISLKKAIIFLINEFLN